MDDYDYSHLAKSLVHGKSKAFIQGAENSTVEYTYDYSVEDLGQITFFLDQSSSANTPVLSDFYKQLREDYPEAEFYTYNFQVQSLAKEDKITFWGPTDSQNLAKFLTSFEGGSSLRSD